MFEPKIVAFLCSWCSYTGADTAGIARLKSPANLRAIRVPCSGRVSPELIMRTFDQGADGVLVCGRGVLDAFDRDDFAPPNACLFCKPCYPLGVWRLSAFAWIGFQPRRGSALQGSPPSSARRSGNWGPFTGGRKEGHARKKAGTCQFLPGPSYSRRWISPFGRKASGQRPGSC